MPLLYLPIGFRFQSWFIHYAYILKPCVSLQVEFTYPAHVSEGSRDLINRLLKHNPMHRLPIQGVMVHPWVVENSTKKPTTRTAADNWGHAGIAVWNFHSSDGNFGNKKDWCGSNLSCWSFLPLFGKLYNLYVAFLCLCSSPATIYMHL